MKRKFYYTTQTGQDNFLIEPDQPRTPVLLLLNARATLRTVIDEEEITPLWKSYVSVARALFEKAAICGHPEAPFFLAFIYHECQGFENEKLSKIWLAIGVEREKNCTVVGEEVLIYNMKKDEIIDNRATKSYERRVKEEGLKIDKDTWILAQVIAQSLTERADRHPFNEIVSLNEIAFEFGLFGAFCKDKYKDLISPETIDNPVLGENFLANLNANLSGESGSCCCPSSCALL